jgi:hypothetical protein
MGPAGIQGWATLQSFRVRAWLVFKSRGRPYLHVLLLYSKLWVEDSEWPETRVYLAILVEILTMPALKKEKGIFRGETVEVEWERTETLWGEYDQSNLQTCMKIK